VRAFAVAPSSRFSALLSRRRPSPLLPCHLISALPGLAHLYRLARVGLNSYAAEHSNPCTATPRSTSGRWTFFMTSCPANLVACHKQLAVISSALGELSCFHSSSNLATISGVSIQNPQSNPCPPAKSQLPNSRALCPALRLPPRRRPSYPSPSNLQSRCLSCKPCPVNPAQYPGLHVPLQ